VKYGNGSDGDVGAGHAASSRRERPV
jgi:hypothetical protein